MDVILDTETTGLKGHDQIIEIAIINADTGTVLIDQRIKPTVNIHPDALATHGITAEALKNAPAWSKIHGRVLRLLVEASRVMIYNEAFDVRMLDQTARAHDRLIPDDIAWLDIMEPYAEISEAEWNDYHGWKWQSLASALAQQNIDVDDLDLHGALDDCQATRRLYLKMQSTFNDYWGELPERSPWTVQDWENWLIEEKGLIAAMEKKRLQKLKRRQRKMEFRAKLRKIRTRKIKRQLPEFYTGHLPEGHVTTSQVRVKDLPGLEYAGTCKDIKGNTAHVFRLSGVDKVYCCRKCDRPAEPGRRLCRYHIRDTAFISDPFSFPAVPVET